MVDKYVEQPCLDFSSVNTPSSHSSPIVSIIASKVCKAEQMGSILSSSSSSSSSPLLDRSSRGTAGGWTSTLGNLSDEVVVTSVTLAPSLDKAVAVCCARGVLPQTTTYEDSRDKAVASEEERFFFSPLVCPFKPIGR